MSLETVRAAFEAEGLAGARKQQPQIVVDLGRGGHRRARIARGVFLPDGNRRRDAVDLIDVGLLHALEKLPRIGRQRLDIAPLPLRIDGVEDQRRLPRPGNAGDHGQLVVRQPQVDVLQVVDPRTADLQVILRQR